MATGVKPRDEDPQITRTDLENIQEAMKSKKFRDMFVDYFEEVRDPANQALYQKEMTQLEKERGYDVTWINPKGGYVIKTSVAGDRKAFINICSNENVAKPSCEVQEIDGQRGMNWSLPYTLIPPREDYNSKREKVVIYDVVFHPDTLRMAELNKQFRELLNKTAFEALAKTYNIHLDVNNPRFPNAEYKGMAVPAVIKTKDPNYKPPTDEEIQDMSPELIEKLYPQHSYSESESNVPSINKESTLTGDLKPEPCVTTKPLTTQQRRKVRRSPEEFIHKTDNGYTIPKYVIKQQKNVDLQDFTYNRDCKLNTAIPSQIVVEVNMPLLSSTKDCILDVQEKKLFLKSERPAKYKLNINLPYSVNDEMGNAKFDKTKHKLIVTLPVKNNVSNNNCSSFSLKADSGVESEENPGSQSEEENSKENLIVEMSSTEAGTAVQAPVQSPPTEELFFNPSLGYLLPTYTHNVMDDIVAFTFHVKNTEPDSVIVKKDDTKIFIKFTSVGSSFVPVHYGVIILFEEGVSFANVTGEAWDNNVILQMELDGGIPQKFQIGLTEDAMAYENFDVSHTKKDMKMDAQEEVPNQDLSGPVVEVTNLGTETNIVVSSNAGELDEDDIGSPTANNEEEDDIVWTDPGPVTGAKSILRKPGMARSYSESSVGDIASSMDYISSDCIPEESSFKKTVRFSNVIARQFYRYNSSIEGQKKKNQRKKCKRRNQERQKSESEAEDDVSNLLKTTKLKIKPVLKQRRDSGLADTSDAENEHRNPPDDITSSAVSHRSSEEIINTTDELPSENNNESTEKSVLDIVNNNDNKGIKKPILWESESESKTKRDGERKQKKKSITTETIQHNTDFYDPEKLNKGQYIEVSFKNDLIFDLDM